MLNKEGIAELRERLSTIYEDTTAFFDRAKQLDEDLTGRNAILRQLGEEAETLRDKVKRLSVDIAGAARGSPLITEVDFHDLRHNTRSILASIHLKEYRYSGIYIHHDEGTFIGADPPSQEEIPVSIGDARQLFNKAAADVGDLIDLLSPAETIQATAATGTATYRPNTAFVMMAIDKKKPELEDTKNTIIDVCKEFGITAITADDIEHAEAITDRILEEIETNEFLIADLSHERPNVYYEIGYAHARDKRVILYCKADTKVHFDVAHRNCPKYENMTDLKERLRKRLSEVTNKPTKP